MAIPTNELLRRYQAGQTDLFETLFCRYKDYVYRVAFSYTRHAQEAEEVVQEAFLDVLRALPQYRTDGPARFETWLYRVTANRCKMRLRRKRPQAADWDEVGDLLAQVPDEHIEHDPESAASRGETYRQIWQAVGALPEIYRQVIVLRYGQELSYAEIAQTLSLNMGTVKSRLHAAHQKLQNLLEGGKGKPGRGKRRGRPGNLLLILAWVWRAVGQVAAVFCMPTRRPAVAATR